MKATNQEISAVSVSWWRGSRSLCLNRTGLIVSRFERQVGRFETVGFFKRKPTLTTEDLKLLLPDGFRQANGPMYEIEIVGESNYQKHITAIFNLVGRDSFTITLRPEPANRYDSNAVAVLAAGECVGYIKRDSAESWQKTALAAKSRKELLTGTAVIRSANGDIYGVFGSIYRPLNPKTVEGIESVRLTPAKIKRSLESLEAAAEAEISTKSQHKAQITKALKAGSALYAHVLSFEPNDEAHNPALLEISRNFIMNLDASADTPPQSGGTYSVIDSFLEEWFFQTGSSRYS